MNRYYKNSFGVKMTLVLLIATMTVLVGCGGTSYKEPTQIVQVGNPANASKLDANLPTEPAMPTDSQVCLDSSGQPLILQASDSLIAFVDGSLPPGMEPGIGVGSGAVTVADRTINVLNPDQKRIQAALNACGAYVDSKVGAAIYQADSAAASSQAGQVYVSGASAEELAKSKYRADKYVVKLMKSPNGSGNAFISGPLTLPSGVTLWIDKGVTLFGSRDVLLYQTGSAGKYCGNTAIGLSGGSSGNCQALITGTNIVNSSVVGEGAIDGRGYSELVVSKLATDAAPFPLQKVDGTCTNTYGAYYASASAAYTDIKGTSHTTSFQDLDGTPCDNGGTIVDTKSPARNMTWWDLAFKGNMVGNGSTGASAQSVPRLMVYNYAKNLTLHKITLNNSPNFHVVPAGIDGFIVWGVKVQTPSLAAYQAPTGNGNPLYTGALFTAGGNGIEGNVKNTDAFDPAAASKALTGTSAIALSTGSDPSNYNKLITSTAGKINFDGWLKNVFFAYNYISTGDDDVAIKGSNAPNKGSSNPTYAALAGVDGDRDHFSYLPHGLVIAHNHIYAGHGISIGSETNVGVRNMYAYDNSFDGGEEGLRIKSDQARGGEVSNIYYDNICMRNLENSLLFTPYYSTKAGTGLIPNFHDIHLNNILMSGTTEVKLVGFQATAANPQYPLVMTLNNVVTDSPTSLDVISSDANLTLSGMINLPLASNPDNRVVVTGVTPVQLLDPRLVEQNVVDCSQAFIDFPRLTSPGGTTWVPPTKY